MGEYVLLAELDRECGGGEGVFCYGSDSGGGVLVECGDVCFWEVGEGVGREVDQGAGGVAGEEVRGGKKEGVCWSALREIS